MRLLIFKGIVEYAAPFSLEELYNHLETIDRSTVFRALTLFEEEHLLHSFEDGSGKRKYCYHHPSHSSHCGETARTCRHIHATCRVCGRSMCITSQEVPVVPLPVDFEVYWCTLIAKLRGERNKPGSTGGRVAGWQVGCLGKDEHPERQSTRKGDKG